MGEQNFEEMKPLISDVEHWGQPPWSPKFSYR